MQVNSFKFKKCFYEAIRKLEKKKERLAIYEGINKYVFDNKLVNFEDKKLQDCWDSIFIEIDKSKKEAIKYWSKRDE